MPVPNASNHSESPWLDPQAQALIRFCGVSKRFGDVNAIESLDLAIYEREFFALLGPSGCGKTTLMRMLAGFEQPSSGQILLDNRDLLPLPPNRRPVNMMFQSYALFPHLSVRDNIAFGLKREKQHRDAIQARVDEMLRLVRLQGLDGRKPHQISGGQRQRVALARALAKAPRVLLLDEPLAALDKKLRQQTQLELVDIQEHSGTTFIVVTHDQEEAMTMASRIAVMDHGRLIQVDTPDTIYEAPNCVYVADFIGDINLLPARAERHDGDRLKLFWAEQKAPILACSPQEIRHNQNVHFAIRPEKIHLDREPPADTHNTLLGQIRDIAYHGHVSTYHVQLSNGQIIKAQQANRHRLTRRVFQWDETVWLSWPDNAGLVLTH